MKNWLAVLLILNLCLASEAQVKYDGTFGKGIRMETKDETFGVKFGTRIQPRWDLRYNTENGTHTNRMVIKRARLKFDGYFINKDLRYKIEYDVVGGYVRDAVVKYRFKPKWDLWFGQTKLPSNRERIVSSGNMQLVDRSLYNRYFTLDRDLGFQLRNEFNLGEWVIRDIWALSSGNGILDLVPSSGVEFTGKFEILPFGKFTKKGDYIGSDIYREDNLKMSLAFGADYNLDAYKSRGQLGGITGGEADLFLIFGDMLLKYKGISLLVEAAHRDTPNDNPLVYDEEGNFTGAFYTGWGFNAQGGYVFPSMWEVSGRFSQVFPDNNVDPDRTDYTVGLSKFIRGHKFKVQADVTYRKVDFVDDEIVGRLQLEMHF